MKFSSRWGVLALVVCIFAFQNFTGVNPVETNLSSNGSAKVVVPIVVTAHAVPESVVVEPPCATSDRNVIYLRFPAIADGDRVTGTIEDFAAHESVQFDIVVGRDFVVGNCQDRNYSEARGLKVCFKGAVGHYFDAQFTGDRYRLHSMIPGASLCEGSTASSIDLPQGT